MTRSFSRIAGAASLALAATLSACGPPPPISPQDRADRQAQAACRARADAVYAQQNRGTIFAGSDDKMNPFSGSYNPGVTTKGLGEQYGRDTMIAECMRNATGATNPASTGPAMTPAIQGTPGTRAP